MKRSERLIAGIMPWAGLVIGVLAVATVHQFGSDRTFNNCAGNAPLPIIVAAVLGIAACVAAGLTSWRAYRSTDDLARRVFATISIGCACVFGLAILLPVIADLVLPPCFQ